LSGLCVCSLCPVAWLVLRLIEVVTSRVQRVCINVLPSAGGCRYPSQPCSDLRISNQTAVALIFHMTHHVSRHNTQRKTREFHSGPPKRLESGAPDTYGARTRPRCNWQWDQDQPRGLAPVGGTAKRSEALLHVGGDVNGGSSSRRRRGAYISLAGRERSRWLLVVLFSRLARLGRAGFGSLFFCSSNRSISTKRGEGCSFPEQKSGGGLCLVTLPSGYGNHKGG